MHEEILLSTDAHSCCESGQCDACERLRAVDQCVLHRHSLPRYQGEVRLRRRLLQELMEVPFVWAACISDQHLSIRQWSLDRSPRETALNRRKDVLPE